MERGAHPEMRDMTPGETYAFMYGSRLLEVTPVFTVTDMVGFARDEIHAHAFWSVRVDGQIYGSFEIADLAARGPRLEGLVVGWYQRERARRADREEWSG